MSSRSVVREARALDRVYDPIHTQGSHPLTSSHTSLSSSSSASSYRPALFSTTTSTSTSGGGGHDSLYSSSLAHRGGGVDGSALRSLVTGPERLRFFKRPLRAIIAAQHVTPALSSAASASSPHHHNQHPQHAQVRQPTHLPTLCSCAVLVGLISHRVLSPLSIACCCVCVIVFRRTLR
jgi:hypothetical protein